MKKNSVIRIVLYTLLVILLLGVLVVGIAGRNINWFHLANELDDWDDRFDEPDRLVVTGSPSAGTSSAGTADPAAAPGTAFRTDGITDLDIEWANGTVTVQYGDVDGITVAESPATDTPMYCYVDEDSLEIHYQKSPMGLNFRGPEKDLTITLPRNYIPMDLSLSGASLTLEMEGITISQALEVDGASNTCELRDCVIGSVSLDGASNRFALSGSLRELDADGASTVCTLELTEAPSEIDMDGVSNRLELTIPDASLDIRTDGLNSSVESDFPLSGDRDHHFYTAASSGSVVCRISMDGVSSSVIVRNPS